LIGGRVWYDDHLLRDGDMNPNDIESLIDEWTALGFQPMEERDGERMWKDVCVIESMFGGPTLPCEWLALAGEANSAYLKGTDSGSIVGRKRHEP
jgi:hypothetical protein